ncbi:protein disulfide oxidoreductase [Vibrio sp. D404a]|uniref:protein disulfide oxidoreductase n=1 Tax=unclassified Vibrio TaxID=2614977 RepID=UPI002553EF8B|nr:MULTISPECIES: protein disulfide oxidoreductase [unclassified Vibrio]MDK9736329.1 protein disulfide oxidoreductase [Vibrio sp. D404a]MDK9795951.1 protein disulfide oxidoreductase [Vibrio sp. D449a]
MPQSKTHQTKQTSQKRAGIGQRIKRWSKELLSILLIVGIISAAMDFYRAQSMPQGDALPMVGTTVQGEQVDLLELSKQGEPVIVYFWATWCGACKFVSPSVDWLAKSHNVVSVSLSSGSNERVSRFMQAKDYSFPVLNDVNGHIGRDWAISVTPTIAIIKDGEIKSITTGVTTPFGIWLRAALA